MTIWYNLQTLYYNFQNKLQYIKFCATSQNDLISIYKAFIYGIYILYTGLPRKKQSCLPNSKMFIICPNFDEIWDTEKISLKIMNP